ncbi:hypothetical protein BC628DRAFT_1369765 [Trametes gibbosa]|nr:hypothetical protein BC628DRAFT_1369765 [Trametes gibbosa]
MPWVRCREPSPFARSTGRDLHVPFLTVENKKENGDLVKAGNQARAYMAGVLRFFHSLGITNVPVYTLITEGTTGVVIFGWCEEESRQDNSGIQYTVPVVHIMERNAPTFDISKPIDAINLAAFLFRLLHIEAPKLARLMEKACEELRGGTRSFVPWTQDHQNPQPKRGQSADPDQNNSEEPKP